jgi:hypothetical protein
LRQFGGWLQFFARCGFALDRRYGGLWRFGIADRLSDDSPGILWMSQDTRQQDIAKRRVDQFGDTGTGLHFEFLVGFRGWLGLRLRAWRNYN